MPIQQVDRLDHLVKTLQTLRFRDGVELGTWQLCDRLPENAPPPDEGDEAWRTIRPGDLWGASSSWAWLRAAVDVPSHFAGKAAILLLTFEPLLRDPTGTLFSDVEALVTVDGVDAPQQAVNYMHEEFLLAEAVEPGPVTVTLHCFCGVSRPDHQVRLKTARLVWLDPVVEALFWDARVLLDACGVLPQGSSAQARGLRALEDAFREIDWRNPPDAPFRDGVRRARARLQATIYTRPLPADTPLVHALGHAHIDIAWLWPLRVARGKAVRTFSTALAYMDRYLDYTFTQSQPHLYQAVAEDDPALFERVRAAIQSGRWNATGATWVEMDSNLPGGESLVRQFLYGMRYFQQVLGVRPEVLWLPDAFGFSAALPQLMRQAGVDYFFTSKLSWNSHARLPADTFQWEGMDGSRVIAHVATTPEIVWDVGHKRDYTNYVGVMQPEDVAGTWTRYRQQQTNRHLMTAFGLGDGGGGPNRDMIERRARLENLPGLPRVVHSSAEAFFRSLEADLSGELPRWVGELYGQFHRGTYTSLAALKRLNRQCEALLHDAEFLAVWAQLLGLPYPQQELHEAWKKMLVNQFHDILPGSSVAEVNQEAIADYLQVKNGAQSLIDRALTHLAQRIQAPAGFAIVNSSGSPTPGPVELTLPTDRPVGLSTPTGAALPFQWLDRATGRALLLPANIPPYGYSTVVLTPGQQPAPAPAHPASATPTTLENGLLRATFDDRGSLLRLTDLETGQELLADGAAGNQLWACVDRPHEFDAWEVMEYVDDQRWLIQPTSMRVVEDGPLRATVEVSSAFNRSTITQRISLFAGQKLLTFETTVDWQERHILLKAAFPLAIRAPQATFEVQFGALQRPTHRNTAWDQAQFEVPAQQWADLSEAGCGVTLLNDGKYGYSARDNVLSLSLLRAPTFPDPQADQGRHQFTYGLLAHDGDWRRGTIDQARRLNQPLRSVPLTGNGGDLPPNRQLVSCSAPGALIDTIKKGEDDDALIIRIYESRGGRSGGRLQFTFPVAAAAEVNILEEMVRPVAVDDDGFPFAMTPFQLRTFRIVPDRTRQR